MIRMVLMACSAFLLTACGPVLDLRNSPAEQVEDYATCKAGGMSTYQTAYGEVMCKASDEEVKP